MATAIQIEVILDEKGVVQGAQKITDGIKRVGQQGNVVFTEFSKRQKDAREATEALAYGLGVNVPFAIQKILTKIPGVAGALSALGKAAGIGALIVGIAEAITNLDELKGKAAQVGVTLVDAGERLRNLFSGNGFTPDSVGLRAQQEQVSDALKSLSGQVDDFASKARTAGLQGLNAIAQGAKEQVEAVKRAGDDLLDQAEKKYGLSSDTYQKIAIGTEYRIQQATIEIEKAKQAQIIQLRRQTADETRQIEEQAAGINLTGTASIKFDEKNANRKIDEQQQLSLKTAAEADAARAANHQVALAKIFKEEIDFNQQMNDTVRATVASSATGIEQIAEQTKNKIIDLVTEFNKEFGGLDVNDPTRKSAQAALQNATDALNKARDISIQKEQRDAAEQTLEIQEKAAAASVPPWERANAQVVNSYNQSLREIQRLLEDHEITEEDAQKRRAAIWQETNAEILDNNRQLRDQLAGELESVFDDITSGNIGRRILQEIKHFFAEIVASWILSLGQIRGATAGSGGGGGASGGLLGGILGSVLGLPGGGGGGGGTPPFFPGGGTGIPFLGNNSFASFGGGILGNAAFGNGTLSAGAGTGGAVQQQTANTLFGSLIQKGLGKIFTHGAGPLSGTALGLAGATIGIESAIGAYHSGSPLGGALGGAAGGALTGFAFGGPVGAAIGAVVGAVGGLLSGIFGRRAKEQKAWAIVNDKYQPAIVGTVADYKNYQLDYQSAIEQLQQLQDGAKQELSQFGKTGDYIFARAPGASITYRITGARHDIDTIEADRQGRATINFAPPQFAGGGTFMSAVPGMALLHPFEEVVKEPYASRNRGVLKAINRGETPTGGGSNVTIVVNAIDAPGVAKFFKDNARMIRQAVRADKLNYAGGADF